jgi:hypothetical protein
MVMPKLNVRRLLASAAPSTLFISAGLFVAPAATAAEAAVTPVVMQEPGDVTDVIDAFDDDNNDMFDISVSLAFQYLSKRARILRETAAYEPGLTTGGFTTKLLNVGEYIETTSKLIPRLDIGIYKDLAFYTRIPIILDNARRIDEIDGSGANQGAVLDAGINPVTGQPEQIFGLPFKSPDRSGLEYVALGLDLAIFNQARDRTKPTWVLGTEVRITGGEPMHACRADDSDDEQCFQPGDVNQNGAFDGETPRPDGTTAELESRNAGEERTAGVTRGTVALEVHSLISKRLKYIEPYGGLTALFEFQQAESADYGSTDLEGALVNHPPIVGTVLVGMMIHPWENREAFGRLTIDLRFQGEYHSEGRDYSELFDAIGSSSARSLRTPEWARFKDACPNSNCNPKSVVDEGSEKTYVTGLSVVEPYGSYRASGSVTWRAGEYVKLNAGLGLRFDQAHGISHDQPCNPDLKDDIGKSGPCHTELGGDRFRATGVPNPAYRPVVNAIGRRFYVDESITYEVFASGTVMF